LTQQQVSSRRPHGGLLTCRASAGVCCAASLRQAFYHGIQGACAVYMFRWLVDANWTMACCNGIVACMSKQMAGAAAAAAAAAATLQGIKPNVLYSILARRGFPSGTKLLRLHCPCRLPRGSGRALGALELLSGRSPEAQAVLDADESLAAGSQDGATFWCSCWYVQSAPCSESKVPLNDVTPFSLSAAKTPP